MKKVKTFLEHAVKERQCSAIGFTLQHKKCLTEFYLGQHAHPNQDAEIVATHPHSIFDLASLTKILSTVCLLFSAESEGKLSFTDPVKKYFPAFAGEETTIYDLMVHRSGLPAHIEFFRRIDAGEAPFGTQSQIASWICEAKLEKPGEQVYSDLGFMLLGFLLESLYGKTIPAIFQERMVARLKLERSGFVTLPFATPSARFCGLLAPPADFVATENCPWRKKTLQGEVHDDNTWAMGGYAGHAGLFSTAREVGTLFQHLWHQAKAHPAFLTRKPEAPGIFSFGFMTYPGLRPFPGPAFAGSLGHTGFTGTSIWYHEPSDTLVTLLANRVHPSRSDSRWIETRLEFHKLLSEELGL